MFRDLKEYHEIAKIYADKVSKPENLEENQANRMKMKELRTSNTPKTREEVGLKNNVVKKPSPFERKFGAERNQQRMISQGVAKKPLPTTAEIRAKNAASGGSGMSNIPSKEGNAVIDGKKINPDFGKKVEIKNEPKISKFTKQGKERTKAQMMAAKRIASGKTIQDVKDANTDAMKKRAAERFAAFKAKRAAGKMNEDVTPYDIVLEYLLSTEQAATIEEANYVMTEMDAETIQGIVEEQKKNFDEGAGVAAAALATGLLTYGLYKRNQYKKDAEKRDEKTNFGKIQKATDAKNKLLKDAGMGGS